MAGTLRGCLRDEPGGVFALAGVRKIRGWRGLSGSGYVSSARSVGRVEQTYRNRSEPHRAAAVGRRYDSPEGAARRVLSQVRAGEGGATRPGVGRRLVVDVL